MKNSDYKKGAICNCEHLKHFTARTKLEGIHEYQAVIPEHTAVRVITPYGEFIVCKECADTCYRQYPRRS